MTRYLLPLLATLFLAAPTCDPEQLPPDPGNGSDYCYGNDYTVTGYARDVGRSIEAILMGEESVNRRATFRVKFGEGSYCTGVALSPRVVLTAGHCGPGVDNHLVIEGSWGAPVYQVESKKIHPDYLKYMQGWGLEYRKADLMLLYMAEDVPGPYLPPDRWYSPMLAKLCSGLVAQGFGKHEGTALQLRETKYVITDHSDPKYLKSRAAQLEPGQESGRICFGDSGGPLYADVNGVLWLSGVTTTTMSSDCLVGGTHVAIQPVFADWIRQNANL